MSRTAPKRKPINKAHHGSDKVLLIFMIAMSIFGAIMIFDASVYQANQVFGDQFYFLKSQLVWLALGAIPAFIAYMIDYKKLLKLALPGLIVIIIFLLAVLIFGEDVNGSKIWFQIVSLPPIKTQQI